MKSEKRWLLVTARQIALDLKPHARGTRLRVRVPHQVVATNTGGWYVTLGSMGRNGPWAEVWLDQFTGYAERRFYACLYAEGRRQINSITNRVHKHLVPIRVLTDDDLTETSRPKLADKLRRRDFEQPILERYSDGITYFGIYYQSDVSSTRGQERIPQQVSSFFKAILGVLAATRSPYDDHEMYSRHENRKHVRLHLMRERNSFLADKRKSMDDYVCQVCNFDFSNVYGDLGRRFAEAHHVVPLSQLRGRVRTSIEDLITVCANCHRMLHRMEGSADDLRALKRIVRHRLR